MRFLIHGWAVQVGLTMSPVSGKVTQSPRRLAEDPLRGVVIPAGLARYGGAHGTDTGKRRGERRMGAVGWGGRDVSQLPK